MVVIRLARGGSKKSPFYNIVVADKRCARDGRFIERLGYFNPMARGQATRLTIEQERVQYWLSKGAQASERVASLLSELAKAPEEAKPTPTKAALRQAQADAAAKASKKAKQEEAASAEQATVAGEEEAK